MSWLLVLLAVFAALAGAGWVFGFAAYRALLKRTKVETRQEDSILTYPMV